jgi:hypothetical protein
MVSLLLLIGGNWQVSFYSLPPCLDLEERLTEKVRAAWALDIPSSTAEIILRLRSTE